MNMHNNLAVTIWSLILVVLFSSSLFQSRITGDGRQYLLYVEAFSSHLSPDIRNDDVLRVAGIVDKSDSGFKKDKDKFGNDEVVNGLRFGRGFVSAQNGALYANHFWLYSLFVTPFFQVTNWLGLSPAYAFTLCNWLFVLGTLSYLAFFWKAPVTQKNILASLFMLSGTTYYIWWSHPEVYTSSLMLVAFMMVSDKRYGLALIFTALAATQNPPVMFMLGFVLAIAFIDVFQKQKFDIANASHRVNVFSCFLVSIAVAFLPMLFYWSKLGIYNPIIASGMTNQALVGFDRLESLYFDFNLGMIVALPGVFTGIVVVFLISAVESKFNVLDVFVKNRFLVGTILLSVAMALPSLSTMNWNHGQSVYSRYAYWLSIPIIYGLVASISTLSRKKSLAVIFLVVCMQLATVFYYGLFGNNFRSHYLEFKPISKFLFLHYPQIYNPIPAIFIERLNHREGVPKPEDKNGVVFAYPSIDEPTKILLSKDMANVVSHRCQSASLSNTEGGWVYVNIPPQSKCDFDYLR